MRAAALAVLLAGCVTTAPAKPVTTPAAKPSPMVAVAGRDTAARPDDEVRTQVRRFLAATQKRDFEAAWRLLAEPLRDRYTPKRLKADFEAEPLAEERLTRIRLAVDLPFRVEGRRAFLKLSEGRVLELVQEPTGWHIAALE